MKRKRQKIKAWYQNMKIRTVPCWREWWMQKDLSSDSYESCMEEYYAMEEAKENWKTTFVDVERYIWGNRAYW